MNLKIKAFKTAGNKKENLIIGNFNRLTGQEASSIREEITACLRKEYEVVYLNAKDVTEVDLSGINEIIHSNYLLQQVAKKMVFVYRKNSLVEKWVSTTGLDAFIDTAIIPVD